MVILFGSYARGNWVEDKYVDKGVLYEYKSDYDILVVLTGEDLKLKQRIEKKIMGDLVRPKVIKTPVSLIFHGIKYLNQALMIGNYFFKDIREEGIVLFDTEKFKLASPKKLTSAQYQQKAQDYYDQWYENGNNALKMYQLSFAEGLFFDSAFQLHQATERFYTTVLLVYTDYRPKDHNLETLGERAEMCDKRFAVFPKETKEEIRLFELLKKAYIDARYKMDEYATTPNELEYLAGKVNQLKRLTQELCLAKIKEIGERGS